MRALTQETGWKGSDTHEAQGHLNEIGSRLYERATAIAILVDGARDAIGMSRAHPQGPLDSQFGGSTLYFGGSTLSAHLALEAAIALSETLLSDAETLQCFELPKQEMAR